MSEPSLTISKSRATSPLRNNRHPWLFGVPILSSWFVPCIYTYRAKVSQPGPAFLPSSSPRRRIIRVVIRFFFWSSADCSETSPCATLPLNTVFIGASAPILPSILCRPVGVPSEFSIQLGGLREVEISKTSRSAFSSKR